MENIEMQPPIGALKAFKLGVCDLFKNIKPAAKLMKDGGICALLLFGMLIFLHLITLFGGKLNGIFLFCLIFFVLIGFIIFFCRKFWHYLIELVAISYLAKDIAENKPPQMASDYRRYVREYGIQYAKFWGWAFLFSIAASSFFSWISYMLFYTTTDIYIPAILSLLFSILISAGVFLGIYAYAYGDKFKPLKRMLEGIKIAINNFFYMVLFTILYSFIALIGLILSVLSAYIIYLFISCFNSNNPQEWTGIVLYAGLGLPFIFTGFLILFQSIITFVFTRFYFDVKNK